MNIAEYLEHAGMTPEAFADLIGVHGGTVRRWMSGSVIKSDDMESMIRVTHGKITADALLRSNGKRKRGAA